MGKKGELRALLLRQTETHTQVRMSGSGPGGVQQASLVLGPPASASGGRAQLSWPPLASQGRSSRLGTAECLLPSAECFPSSLKGCRGQGSGNRTKHRIRLLTCLIMSNLAYSILPAELSHCPSAPGRVMAKLGPGP